MKLSNYTSKSRIAAKRAKRRKKRRKQLIRNLSLFALVIGLTVLGVIGVKSGLEMCREIKYPVQYSEYITKYAKENDLDPYLVIAVIKQESNFIADARSPYAGGLMQLTEETAADYAKKMGLSNYNYMDPETNIQIGCFVLRSLIDRYEYTDTALAAYNAGIGNVDSWLSNSQYSNDGETLSYIPFPETRHYVEKVNNYVISYKENTSFDN